jgi:hypothetical protein
LPIQLASRGKSSILPVGYVLVTGDHDFHIVNLTPSVTLLTEVKAHLDGNRQLPSLIKIVCLIILFAYLVFVSYYFCLCILLCVGTVHIFLKDSIFEASSPTRHTNELGRLIKKMYSRRHPLYGWRP